MQPIGKDRRAALLRALVKAERDVVEIAREHKLSLEQLADWAEGEDVQRRLASLCGLADAQAQFQVSRYRYIVAQHLVKDATQEGATELARRVRLDAMKLEVWQPAPPTEPAAAEPSTDADDTAAAMRALLAAQPEEGGDDALDV